MKYRVHRLEVREDTAQETLEQFLNQLEGEVLAIDPCIRQKPQLACGESLETPSLTGCISKSVPKAFDSIATGREWLVHPSG